MDSGKPALSRTSRVLILDRDIPVRSAVMLAFRSQIEDHHANRVQEACQKG